MSSVLWSGQSCGYRGSVDENILVMFDEWIPSDDMVKLYELSSTVYAISQGWFDDQTHDALGDQTWIGMSEERVEFTFGEGKK